MKLLQDGLLDSKEILMIFLSILLGVVAFFLREFYIMVKTMFNKIEKSALTDTEHSQRISVLEDDVQEIKTDMKRLHK